MVTSGSTKLRVKVDRRLVLYPYGPPDDDRNRERCAQLVLWCGGTVDRTLDNADQAMDRYISYLSRIRGLRDATENALVVLTRTIPLPLTVVELRARMEGAIPALRSARWVLYVDDERDPFFEKNALQLGHLTGALSEAPLWVGPRGCPFLVLSPLVRDRSAVDLALDELDELVAGTSEVRPRRG